MGGTAKKKKPPFPSSRKKMLLLGTAQLSSPYGVMYESHKHRRSDPSEILRLAERSGFDGVDTSPVYPMAEEEIGKSSTQLHVYTKLQPGVSATQSIQTSLVKLAKTCIAGVFFHERLSLDSGQKIALREMTELKGATIEQIGASIYDADEFELALSAPEIDVIQLPLSVADQRFFDQIQRARDAGKRLMARSIFLQGVLLTDPHALPDNLKVMASSLADMRKACDFSGLTPMEACVGFIRDVCDVDAIIAGFSSTTHVEEFLTAWNQEPQFEKLERFLGRAPVRFPASDPRRW